jgi:predicted transcriptional regulator
MPGPLFYPDGVQATKQRVKDLLDRLPDDCSLEDVVYHLYVIQKVEAGLADVDAARLIPHDVVAAELRRKWLTGSEQ